MTVTLSVDVGVTAVNSEAGRRERSRAWDRFGGIAPVRVLKLSETVVKPW